MWRRGTAEDLNRVLKCEIIELQLTVDSVLMNADIASCDDVITRSSLDGQVSARRVALDCRFGAVDRRKV